MKNATRTTLDAAGRLMIPVAMRVEKEGRVAVAVPEQSVPTLSAEAVERVLRELRHRVPAT